jgi:histidine triad (HIT) family protein
MPEECVFCKIVKGELPCKKVYENDNFLAFLDINPKAEGHTVMISKQHYRTILDLPKSLGMELLDAVKEVSMKLMNEKKGAGFNVIVNNFPAAGQVVDHVHVHIIPRNEGDGLHMIV